MRPASTFLVIQLLNSRGLGTDNFFCFFEKSACKYYRYAI